MNIRKFKDYIGYQEPMMCIQGDILETELDDIVFAVNYPNLSGEYDNTGGFAGEICRRFWPELKDIKFTEGEVISHYAQGKRFHAIAVHSNEPNGWKNAPALIESCLNKIRVSSEEGLAIVLIGSGAAGKKWKASVDNIVGMSRSYKNVVLYIKNKDYYKALIRAAMTYESIPLHLAPKTLKYRTRELAS
ncbi:MAG TPA: hypothetical protein PKI61_01495 [bacterium]|nr:hypothetical protein [bacterium]HPT29685.1 hypothetical protein [bacterium]